MSEVGTGGKNEHFSGYGVLGVRRGCCMRNKVVGEWMNGGEEVCGGIWGVTFDFAELPRDTCRQ